MTLSCCNNSDDSNPDLTELQQIRRRLQQRRFSEALSLCDRRLQDHPNCAITHQQRGQVLGELQQWDQAQQSYQQAIAADATRPQPYAYLGELYDRAQAYPQAAECYHKALQRSPQWQAVRYNLARSYLQQEEDQQALHHYQIALAQNPDDAKAYNDLGTLYERWGQLQQAQTYYEVAIARQPNRLQPHYNLANLLLKQNRPQDAQQLLEQALTLDPNRADLYHLLGWCARLQNRLDSALGHYLRSLQLNPQQPQVHEDLGKLFDRLQQPAAALTCFQRAIELQPDHLDHYGACAQMALQLHKIDDTLTAFSQALDQFPSQARTWLQQLLNPASPASSDPYDQALAARSSFLKHLLQGSPQTITALAHLYRRWGDVRLNYEALQEAQVYYQLALQLNPQNREAESGLGLTTWRQEQRTSDHPTRQSLNPNNPEGVWLDSETALAEIAGSRYLTLSPRHRGDRQQAVSPGQCDGINCQPCLNRIREHFAPIALRQQQYHCSPESQLPDVKSHHFLVEIPKGRIWTMAQTHWWKVCEAIAVISPDNSLLGDLSREYPGELPGCPNATANISQHRSLTQRDLPPIEEIPGTVAVLTGLSANVYFHWMVDILPRIEILRQGSDWGDIDWFYVNSLAKPFQRESLLSLGIPLERVLESDLYPHLRASRLRVPSFASPLGWASPSSIEFLRSHFLDNSTPSPNPACKRLYISRQTAHYRKIINEPDLIKALETHHITPIRLEDYSIREQAQLFAQAELIIAPHGAGLTNLMFCQPQTRVIELFSPSYIRYYYWSICQYLKLNYYYLVGETLPCRAFRHLLYPDVLTEDFWIDIEALFAVAGLG